MSYDDDDDDGGKVCWDCGDLIYVAANGALVHVRNGSVECPRPNQDSS